MGAGSSNPLGTTLGTTPRIATTHTAVFTNTEHTRHLMNEILKYMINQVSVRDLLHMSKKEECKKYVLFKANSLYEYFHELRVFPSTDSRGLLTFRKVEDLVSPKGDTATERQSLCLVIAYFYTRIFQIYGALAMTLIDDMNFMTSTGLTSAISFEKNARRSAPGFIARPSSGGSVLQTTSVPLSDKVALKNFEWIRSFLTTDTSATGYPTRYIGSGDMKGYVFFKLDDVFKDGFAKDAKLIPSYTIGQVVSTVQSAQFKIGITGEYHSFEIFTQKAPDKITVRTGKLTFKNKYDETITTERFKKEFSVELQPSTNSTSKGTYIIKDTTVPDVSAYLAELLSEVISYLKGAIKLQKESSYFTSETSTNKFVAKLEEGITDRLKIEEMITKLRTERPLGHCIARALQLLRAEPFEDGPSISQICRVKFSDEKDEKVSNRIGLPKKGKSLSSHPGLFALSNLFYDTIAIGSPKLTIGRTKDGSGKSTFDDYVTFMRNMAELYGDKLPDDSKLEDAGLSSISNKRDAALCKSDDDIKVSAPNTAAVREIVKTMFQAQMDHSGKCYQIVNQLFTIQEDKSTGRPVMFKLNNNLIVKGFPELERISTEARNLLVNYYTNCEKKYRDGMDIVLGIKPKNSQPVPATSAATATGTATAAGTATGTVTGPTKTLPSKAVMGQPSARQPPARQPATGLPATGQPAARQPTTGPSAALVQANAAAKAKLEAAQAQLLIARGRR